jgi:hypothetical protein
LLKLNPGCGFAIDVEIKGEVLLKESLDLTTNHIIVMSPSWITVEI